MDIVVRMLDTSLIPGPLFLFHQSIGESSVCNRRQTLLLPSSFYSHDASVPQELLSAFLDPFVGVTEYGCGLSSCMISTQRY